jgi:hypothetical protein
VTTATEQKIEGVVALLGIYIKRGKADKGLKLLRDNYKEFVEAGAADYWHVWRGQLLVAKGDASSARTEIDHVKDSEMRRNLKTLVLEASSRESGDWEPLKLHLQQSFEATNDGGYLFELCRLSTQTSDWIFAADHAEQLVKLVATSDAVEFAAEATWRTERYDQCLRILSDNQILFPNRILPAHLRRLRVRCHVSKGSLSLAVSEAESLIQSDPSTENIITLIDVQISKGDLTAAAITARTLRDRADVSPLSLLRAAALIHTEDSELAKSFWLRAKNVSLDEPELLAAALNVGFALDMQAELGPLIQRMHEFASKGQGSFKALNMGQVLELMKERADRMAEVYGLYARAEIPLHLLSGHTKRLLADYLHSAIEQNRQDFNPLAQLPVFTRFGGRPIQEVLSEKDRPWQLYLDISAVLLAADVDILEMVERVFKPLKISTSLQLALVEQYKELQRPTPTRVSDARLILQLKDRTAFKLVSNHSEGSIESESWKQAMGEPWLQLLHKARQENGFVVEILPLRSNDAQYKLVTLPSEIESHIVNCRSVVDALRNAALITKPTYESALKKLQNEGTDLGRFVPPIGSTLVLTPGTLALLADAQILEALCLNFSVLVDPIAIDIAKDEVDAAERRVQLSSWLKQLIEHIRTGLEIGTYELIEISDELRAKATEERSQTDQKNEDDLTIASFTDLFLFAPRQNDALWIDDRFTTQYLHRDGVPIIGINEVLVGLRSRKELSDDEYFETILKLRAGNVRYIPIEVDEILYHLNRTDCVNGGLVETKELTILKRYLAACFLDNETLQRPVTRPNSDEWIGELGFVLNAQRVVADAIFETWNNPDVPSDIASIRSDWLLHRLYTGGFGIRELLPDPESRGDGLDLIGIDLGGLYMKALTMQDTKRVGEKLTCRQQYFHWLNTRLTTIRFRADPGSIAAVAKTISGLISGAVSQRYEDPKYDFVSRLVVQKLFLELPEMIRDELELDSEVMARLSVTNISSATVGNLSFEPEIFWDALTRAIKNERVSIQAHHPEGTFVLRKDETQLPEIVIAVEDSDGQIIEGLKDEIFGLLSEDPSHREKTLRENRSWFDCSNVVFEKELKEIIQNPSVRARMERVDRWRKQSVQLFYDNLAAKIRNRVPIRRSDLLPASGDGLLSHFRLTMPAMDVINFKNTLFENASALIEEEGWETALERLMTFPVKLPLNVSDGLNSLTDEELHYLLNRLVEKSGSPISKANLIDLSLRCSSRLPTADVIGTLITDLYDDSGEVSFDLFTAFLTVINEEFGYWAEASEWSAETKLILVWAHASRVHNLFHRLSTDPENIVKWLRADDRLPTTEILARDPHYWYDVLHPRRLNRAVFLTHGLASLLSDKNYQELTALGIIDRIGHITFTDWDKGSDTNVPNFHLLRDPTLARNTIGSIFGGDRSIPLSPIVGTEKAEVFSSASLKKLVKEALDELLTDPSQFQLWLFLAGVIESNLIYSDLRQSYHSLLQSVDLASFYSKDPLAARLALQLAADYSLQIGDESLRQRLEAMLLRMLSLEKAQEEQRDRDDESNQARAAAELLEACLTLSMRPGDTAATSRSFGDLFMKMLSVWPQLATYYGSTISKLLFELPVAQLRGLWPVMLRIRAS